MNDITLHPATAKQLERIAKNPPQALIINGKKGIGTTDVALFIAAKLTAVIQTITPKKRIGTQPVEDYDNGAIIIDDIRDLYEQTRSKLTEPRVFIFDFGDRTMTHGAQNAFLKLLEEPQPKIHFILATHHPDALLPTILSRCQRIDLRPITTEQTSRLLDQLAVTDSTKRARIEFIATGLPAELRRLAADQAYYEQRVETVQHARAIIEGTPYARLLIIRKYKDQRPQALQLIDDVLLQLQRSLTRSYDKRLIDQIDALVAAYEKIKANGNIQLQLTSVLL